VAILTLRRVGVGPAPLLTAAEKVAYFNLFSTKQGLNAYRYRLTSQRFAQAIVAAADSLRVATRTACPLGSTRMST
jgi:hypothetical protein